MLRKTAIALLVVASSWSLAAGKITCNTPTNSKISGVHTFELIVDSEASVRTVEFYRGIEIEDADESTPYEFTFDTLPEPEGPFKAKFIASLDDGSKLKIELDLTIDNGLGLGLAHWNQTGADAVANSKWDDAIRAGRIAQKIDGKNATAKMVLARAYYGKGEFDQAQKYCQQLIELDANNFAAHDLLSGVNLQRAFRAGRNQPDRKLAAKTLVDALVAAAQSRLKNYETQLNLLGAPNDENRLKVADVALRAGRYSAVITSLAPLYAGQLDNSPLVNRYLYANIRAGRLTEATAIAANYSKRGTPDGEGMMLLAYLAHRAGNVGEATAFENQAVLEDAGSMGVRMMQAYLGHERNNTAAVGKIASTLLQNSDQYAATYYYAEMAANASGDFDRARSYFESAVMTEPSMPDVYIQEALQNLLASQDPAAPEASVTNYRAIASAYLDGAIAAKPESFVAWALKSFVAVTEGEGEEAIRLAGISIRSGEEYAGGHLALAIATAAKDAFLGKKLLQAQTELTDAQNSRVYEEIDKKARALEAIRKEVAANRAIRDEATRKYQLLDAKNLRGVAVPDAKTALRYFNRFGRLPVIELKPAK